MKANPPAGCRPADLAARIIHAALEAGYADCGFAGAEPFPEYLAELERRSALWPAAAALYRALARRADPRADAPWARAIVVAVRRYGRYRLPQALLGHIGRNYLADRRMPAGPDHDLPQKLTARLRALGLRVRRGGVPDRAAAARAGVVAIGRNGFAYSPRWGSWINLETWRVDADLPPGRPLPCPCPDGCRACLEACPTRALERPYVMRPDRCVAYLTYGAPEPIAPELWERMGAWIYGCDDCQTACPLNRGRWEPLDPAPWLEAAAEALTPAALAAMNLDTYRRLVHPLFGYIPDTPVGLVRWRRNAARALKARRQTVTPPDLTLP